MMIDVLTCAWVPGILIPVIVLCTPVLMWLYFQPIRSVWKRHPERREVILVLNIMFGWIPIVWIGLLFWAFFHEIDEFMQGNINSPETDDEPTELPQATTQSLPANPASVPPFQSIAIASFRGRQQTSATPRPGPAPQASIRSQPPQ